MRLAFEITKICTSEKDAQKAQESFVSAFQKNEIPEDVVEVLASKESLIEILLEKKIIASNGDARRLTEAGAITYLDSGEIYTFDALKEIPIPGTYKIGKSRFIKII
jgi:tyrosyl-tRNA synthetase